MDRGSLPFSAHPLAFSHRMLTTYAFPLPSLIESTLPPPFGDYEYAHCDPHEGEPPRYSSRPSSDEETVAFTPRAAVILPQGTFVREWPQAKLVLMDQEDGAVMPSYGRYGQVIGELGLKHPTSIVSVTAKLTGQLNISSPETGFLKLDFVSDTQSLWKQGELKVGGCPSILPVSFQIPMTYEAAGRQWHLPPSLDMVLQEVSTMLVEVVYTLSLTIAKSQFWGQWISNEELAVPLEYYPRTRPVRSVVMYGTVPDSIKSAAEEWIQIIDRMDVRPKFEGTMSPIECQIFIPSIQTFAISDTIPFHLQLIGSVVSLRELLPASSPLLLPCEDTRLPNSGREDNGISPLITIQVAISRQIMIEVNGRRKAHTFTIAEGRLWPVPPCPSQLVKEQKCEKISHNGGDSAKNEMVHREPVEDLCEKMGVSLDWQGEIQCGPEVRFGGFVSSHVSFKDSLVVSLAPPNPRSSFLVPLQVSHPIKLVTDPWMDEGSLHPLDS